MYSTNSNENSRKQYVLITGAGGGMGKACTELLASRGFYVFALDKNPPDTGSGIIPLRVDITDKSSITAALECVKLRTDSLHAILHFAGIYMLDSLLEIPEERFDKIFDVNLRGAYLVNKIFRPLLKNGSRILITTSELANLDPLPFTGIYAVTKAALDKYAYSLRMEMQLLGITVSVLRAGAVSTGMLGVSTDALTAFCENTALYRCGSDKFRQIVDRVESRCIPPSKIAVKAYGILRKKHPGFAYSINRNPLLLLLGILPKRLQLFIIRSVLK